MLYPTEHTHGTHSKKPTDIHYRLFHSLTPIPSVGIALCILLAIQYNYEGATYSHCKTKEWWPSISSATGGGSPEKYIWRICMAIYTFPKLCLDLTHYMLFKDRKPRGKYFSIWNKLTLATAMLENFGLLVLSMISSKENHHIHSIAFLIFIVFAHIHFLCFMPTYKMARMPMNDLEKKCYLFRLVFAICHTLMVPIGGYFYYLHRTYCQPGMYSWASFSELILVYFNICFHTTGWFEWNVVFRVIEQQNKIN